MTTAPHAYSSDTLHKAYQWLQNNPQHQERVNNSDQLVALYLSEKKGLQSFDFSPKISTNLFLNSTKESHTSATPPPVKKKPSIHSSLKVKPSIHSSLKTKPSIHSSPALKTKTTPDNFFSLDEKSLIHLEDTKKTFNLSTQSEALRLLLSIGYEKLHKI